jgi:8-oxo-dGTP pyrophosphatase MutT (NUDIX family)
MSTEREFSAGGVVVRGEECVVIVPVKRSPQGERVLGLPKGHPDGDESAEEAATREVREETGVQARVVERLGDVEYWYRRGGRRVFKTVGFYLCDYISGDTADHDHEVDEAGWMPLERARTELSYPGERRIIERALSKHHGDR